MKRTLYLHIGVQRTATTSVQRYLRANTSALGRQGVLYPLGVQRHKAVMAALFARRKTPADVATAITKEADAQNHDITTVILSDEAICRQPDLSILSALQEHFDLRIVMGLRRQDLWLESWYLQNIKWQWDPTYAHISFKAFLKRRSDFPWIHYSAVLGHLETVFGRETLRPYIYEKRQMPDGPVAAFCDLVGLHDRAAFEPVPHANSAFSPVISEFMRCLPLDTAPEAYRALLEKACQTAAETLPKNLAQAGAVLMSARKRRNVLAKYTPGNKTVAQRYFGRDDLFLDPLPSITAKTAKMTLPRSSYDTMKHLVAPFVQALIEAARDDEAGKL